MASDVVPRRFKLIRKEIPIELEDASGNVKNYVLRELNGTARDMHLNDMGSRVEITANGQQRIKNFINSNATLLQHCLFAVDAPTVPLDIPFIQSFPSQVQEELWNMARELSGLDKDAEDEAKND